jgi:hypothetical protein
MVSPGASDGWVDMAGTYWDPGEMLQKTLQKKKHRENGQKEAERLINIGHVDHK